MQISPSNRRGLVLADGDGIVPGASVSTFGNSFGISCLVENPDTRRANALWQFGAPWNHLHKRGSSISFDSDVHHGHASIVQVFW
jgi:hypothetical protein